MNITISNLAWDPVLDEQVLSLLQNKGITALEIAPGKYISDLSSPDEEEITHTKKHFAAYGLYPESFQAILFGHNHLTIFENKETRSQLHSYLKGIIELAQKLGTKNIIFGSPKNRKYENMEKSEAMEIAHEFFYTLGEYAKTHDTHLCIEPNPEVYGTNFMNTTIESAHFVRSVNSEGFRLHVDTGALHMNNEDPEEIFSHHKDIITHIHASEPFLKDISGQRDVDHAKIAQALQNIDYLHWLSIEMLTKDSQDPFHSIENALDFAKSTYK